MKVKIVKKGRTFDWYTTQTGEIVEVVGFTSEEYIIPNSRMLVPKSACEVLPEMFGIGVAVSLLGTGAVVRRWDKPDAYLGMGEENILWLSKEINYSLCEEDFSALDYYIDSDSTEISLGWSDMRDGMDKTK